MSFTKNSSYITRVENELGNNIKYIRCDNRGEYKNWNTDLFCKNSGIRMEFTSPYSSQQNGVAECLNSTLMNMTRTMLIAADLEKQYWDEAVMTSKFIKNRLASMAIQWNIPYELWYGFKPKMENLKLFGAVAYARIPNEQRLKLDARGKKVMMAGYE